MGGMHECDGRLVRWTVQMGRSTSDEMTCFVPAPVRVVIDPNDTVPYI